MSEDKDYSIIEGMIRQSTDNPVHPMQNAINNHKISHDLYPCKVKFLKTHPDAVLPVVNNNEPYTGDSGYDLTSVETTIVPGRSSVIVQVGLTLADLTPGYWMRIEPRSGLGFKHHLQPHLGVIDNGYRGDLGVKLYNFSDIDYNINKGDRIAQLVVYRLVQSTLEWTDSVTDTSRGSDGFGSSDKKFPCPPGHVPMKVPKLDEGSPDYICVKESESSAELSTTTTVSADLQDEI